MIKHTPLPVRLADMQEAEDRYLKSSLDDRMGMHRALTFYQLLNDEERFVLERRFPNELDGQPDAPNAPDGVRVAWDLRSRELIVCMLQFGQKVLAAGMDLVRTVQPDESLAIFAMTATGSFLEMGPPMSHGTRRYIYRASIRPGGRREDGAFKLEAPILLGNRVDLPTRRTSEIMIIAAGQHLPPDDDTLPGSILYGPPEDEPAKQPNDPMRVAMTRFRILVDAAENAEPGGLRAGFQKAAAEVAKDLQEMALAGGGHPLLKVKSFTTGSGARYELKRGPEGVDLVRHDAEGKSTIWLQGADIADQRVVQGVPLVIFYEGSRGVKNVSFVFRVAKVET